MKKQDIRNAVKLAVDNVIYEGCTDVSSFGHPFEISLLKHSDTKNKFVSEIVTQLEKIFSSNGNFELLKINKISHMLIPKKTFYDFRKCALIDIADEIKYLSIVLIMASKIEKRRVSPRIAFSYRFKPNKNGRIFNKNYNYSAFKSETKKLSSQKKYNIIVECDISNFYDRLNLHRLNSTLLSINDIEEKNSNLIDELLLFWANRDSYGLPVGSNASRILAEAFLIEIDNYLISNNIKFCRFVDDYRFFASDVSEANKILSYFVEILNKHGMSINIGKTNMRDIKGYHIDSKKSVKPSNENISEIIRGYSGLVPAKFRQLSKSEIEKLNLENEEDYIKRLNKDSIIKPEDIIKCIKIIIAKNMYDSLSVFPNILKKYPQFVPYFSDVISKYKNQISAKAHNIILDSFSDWIKDNNTPEYILISIVKMFNSENDCEKKILFDFFKNQKRNFGIYIARTILEQIGNNLSRGELLELKDYFLRSDCWEKRQIVKMILEGLNYPENRPFIKDLKINCSDYFILDMIKIYEKNNKRK